MLVVWVLREEGHAFQSIRLLVSFTAVTSASAYSATASGIVTREQVTCNNTRVHARVRSRVPWRDRRLFWDYISLFRMVAPGSNPELRSQLDYQRL